ncbi:MAG: CbtB-domain containing protein [Acidimicrobiia bacterium]
MDTTADRTTARPLEVPAIAWVAVAIGVLVAYLMLQENGALLAGSWETLHELYHDGRHALGVPCH